MTRSPSGGTVGTPKGELQSGAKIPVKNNLAPRDTTLSLVLSPRAMRGRNSEIRGVQGSEGGSRDNLRRFDLLDSGRRCVPFPLNFTLPFSLFRTTSASARIEGRGHYGSFCWLFRESAGVLLGRICLEKCPVVVDDEVRGRT